MRILMKKLLLLISSTLFISFAGIAQEALAPRDLAPISPNAASLGIFGTIPVGHYTGIPEVSVPIYEIDLDGKKIPIQLSYHASGIRVAQEASWVGLGWALNAGGIITRQVNGGPDFAYQTVRTGANGYPTVNRFKEYYDLLKVLGTSATNGYDFATRGLDLFEFGEFYDGEPDLFAFNFGTHSGKMIVPNYQDFSSSMKATLLNPQDYLHVSYDAFKDQWIAYDGKGYAYFFGTSEKTHASNTIPTDIPLDSLKSRFTETIFPRKVASGTDPNVPEVESAWLLDSIVSPKKNAIRFFYEEETVQNISTMAERFRDYYYDLTKDQDNGFVQEIAGGRRISFHASEVKQAVLKRITFNGGEVIFSTSPRKDLLATNQTGAERLDQIKVLNSSQVIIKDVHLYYSYLGNIASPYSCRLLLDSVKEQGQSPYQFKYNRENLPSKHSLDTDHWGYYNGPFEMSQSDNFYSIPTMVANYSSHSRLFHGREKKSNPAFIQRGILKSITYPTGGETSFSFEPHKIIANIDSYYNFVGKTDILLDLDDDDLDDPSPNPARDLSYLAEEFTIKNGSRSNLLKLTYGKSDYNTRNSDQQTSFTIRVQKKIGDNQYQNINFYTLNAVKRNFISVTPNASTWHQDELVLDHLDEGTYRMLIEKGNEFSNYYSIAAGLSSEEFFTHVEERYGAGLKVVNVENRADGKTERKTYEYGAAELMVDPTYQRNIRTSEIQYCLTKLPGGGGDPLQDVLKPAYYFEASSQSFTPFSYSAKGSMVGYTTVKEIVGDTVQNIGYTEYTFHNIPDELHYYGNDEYSVPTISDPRNGLVKKVTVFGVDNAIKEEIGYEYVSKDFYEFPSILKIGRVKPVRGSQDANYTFVTYHQQFETFRLDNVMTTKHELGNSESRIYTQENYVYDNEFRIKTEVHGKGSDGRDWGTYYVYPFQKSGPIPAEMKRRHMLEVPLERIKLIDEFVVDAESIDYQLAFDVIVPLNLYQLKKVAGLTLSNYASNYEHRKLFSGYEDRGRLTEVTSDGSVKTVYLWGYNKQYPVAIIQNSSYAEVITALGGPNILTQLNAGVSADSFISQKMTELRIALPKSMVSSYTYFPLIGIKSSTDAKGQTTYYGYDNWQRLRAINDQNGNVVNIYDYHYK